MAISKCKIKKDDQVKIITGKDKGKIGRVLKIDLVKERVLVEGINIVKKAMKPKSQNDKGGIIEIEAPLHISNVMVLDKKGVPGKVGYKMDGESKVRFSKKSGDIL